MKIHHNPELLERLAASYALGTLRGPARRRFESIAREHAVVRASALVWQGRLASMNELQTSSQPAPAVWNRIDNLLQAQLGQSAMERARFNAQVAPESGWPGWLRSLTVWRATTAAGVVATVFAVSVGVGLREQLGGEIANLQIQLQATPQIEYVAVLADDKAAPSMLVTFDPKNHKLTLQRVGAYREADDRSLQLWAMPPSGGPKSLGVLGQDKLLRLTAAEGDVREVPALAISLEPKGGVPSATGPTGPVLFKGALIQKLLCRQLPKRY
jgi:anti-sigma-K factor RskA